MKEFERKPNIAVFPVDSANCTSISNTYLTADREKRICKAISHIDPYRPEDLPDAGASIYHLAGLMVGDIGEDMIEATAKRGMCAVDVQCLLRRDEGGAMLFRDWELKKQYLPMIRFLKTDAAEAEILTGSTDRREAAKMLYDWGAKEIMITHNTRGNHLRRKADLRLPAEAEKPHRTYRTRGYHVRRLSCQAPALRHRGIASIRRGVGFTEDGNARAVHGHGGGRSGIHSQILLRGFL